MRAKARECGAFRKMRDTHKNPFNLDGDGVWDGDEVPHSPGSCPTDASDGGSSTNCVTLSLTVGDPSGSESERWNFEVFEEATERTVVRHCDDGFGTPGSAEYALVKGKAYTFSLRWIATNLGYGPDYDWRALINDSDATGAREGPYGTGAFIVEDPDGLLTEERHGDSTDITVGKEGRIIVPKVEVVFSDPDSSQWAELEEKRIVLSDEELRIKIKITPSMENLSDILEVLGDGLLIKTSGTAPNGQTLVLNAQNTDLIQQPDCSELRIVQTRDELRLLGVVPGSETDLIDEKAWLDTGSPDPTADSNLSDGLAFDTLDFEPRGRCTSDGTLESPTENSPVHVSFLQAAGREIITAAFAGSVSSKRQIMNQADYFYYSGHGSHATGSLTVGSPSVLAGYWNQDLDCAIIAGCAVLDINDYNDNYTGADHTVSPGEMWEPLGPLVLLGYNWYAPTDMQGATSIISTWLANRVASGNVNAWRDANKNSAGWNACVIVKNTSYLYYKRVTVLGVTIRHDWTDVPKSDW